MYDATVLLVDDEADFVEIMAKRLAKRNLHVLTASNGPEAIEQLEEHHKAVDVVILDVKMPGMTGIEALEKIKAAYPLVEVVMLTGHATVDSAIEGLKLGAHDYLMKPCEIDVLMAKVNDAKAKKDADVQHELEDRAADIAARRGG